MNKSQKDRLLEIAKTMLSKAKSRHPALEAAIAAATQAGQQKPMDPERLAAVTAELKARSPKPTDAPIHPPTAAMHPPVDLKSFHNMLDQHDWQHDFSDNPRVQMAGRATQTKLEQIAHQSPEHKAMFDGFKAHHFSGDAWKNPKTTKRNKPE